jgi:3-isopropylmalate/(R)-2-methylmalate dehydratase small subunit
LFFCAFVVNGFLEVAMEPFVTHRGRVAVLDWSDVNTDLIIPARYLKRVERTGYGPLLFADKRYVAGGAPDPDSPEKHGAERPDFPLNEPATRDATVLVVGRNFGCGSSREHAVWAVAQAGYRAVIAPGKGEGFADIFEGNAFNNGLLPIELDEAEWKAIADAGRAEGGAEVTIDLRDKTITLHPARSDASRLTFDIPEADRHRLLNGLDAIAETLLNEAAIRQHEQHTPAWVTPQTAGA